MATVAIGLSGACAGGGHLALNVTVNGSPQIIAYTGDEILQTEPSDLIHDFVLAVLRLHCAGMTRAQARSAIQAGFTVTI